MESRQLSTVIAPSSHGFGSIDQTPSAPEWNLSSGTRQENRRPPMSPEEQLRWESESHKTIPGPEDLRLPHSCIGLQHQFTVPDNITVDDDSDDYLLVPEEKAGGGANDQDIDSMSDIYDDNFPSREDPGPELSNNSSEGSDFEHVEATYLNHNESLRGVLNGVICEFTLQDDSCHLDTDAPWFPYKEYPYSFRWGCCGAAYIEPRCHRTV